MKKTLILILAITMLALFMAGCNRQIIDLSWNFTYAYVYCGGVLIAEGKLDSWRDYEESDMIQVKIEGKTYLTHSANVIMEG